MFALLPKILTLETGLVADVESSILQATRSDAAHIFSGLSPDERRHLREWQSAAGRIGIDAVEDLAYCRTLARNMLVSR